MTNIERVWEHFIFKNILFWNLDLSSNTQSKGDLWFECELFIVFVTLQNLNLCWDKANSRLHLKNNGAHYYFFFVIYLFFKSKLLQSMFETMSSSPE